MINLFILFYSNLLKKFITILTQHLFIFIRLHIIITYYSYIINLLLIIYLLVSKWMLLFLLLQIY